MFSASRIPFVYSTFNGSYWRFPGYVLFKWNGIKNVPMVFVGFNNFKAVITDAMFWHSIKNIMWFMVLTLCTQLPIGLLLAVMLSERFRGYRFFKFAYFVPQVLSTTVIGLCGILY